MSEARRRVLEASWPFWKAEFEIGFRAFQAANIYAETGWLAHQIAKEWHGSGVYGPRGTDLGLLTGGAMSESAEQELAHFHGLRALGETMETVPGAHVPGTAARELTRYRNTRWDDPVARHGVRMSEGGGLGMLHGAIAAIYARGAARPQDAAVRDCFASIIADEAGHLGGAINEYLAESFTPEEDALILATLEGCLSRKVDERREQFVAQLVGDWVAPTEGEVEAYRAAIEGLIS